MTLSTHWLVRICMLLALCGTAAARPGGGHSYSGSHSSSSHSYSGGSHSYSGGSHSYSGGSHSYSGGSHSYSGGGGYSGSHSYSGGGGGSGNTAGAAIGIIFLLGLVLVFVVIYAMAKSSNNDDDTYDSFVSPPEPPKALDLSAVTTSDPAFSRVIFEDFAYELYAAAQRARHDRADLMKLAPYVTSDAIEKLVKRMTRVEQVVIGTLRITGAFTATTGGTRVLVDIESNLANRDGTMYTVERWVFERAAGVQTKPLQPGTRAWPCPNCGAAWTAGEDPRTCSHCGEKIEAGRFDWTVVDVYVINETSVGVTLTGTTEEVGNDFPTIETGDPTTALMKLRTDDPEMTWDGFTAHVRFVYAQLNQAWNAQDMTAVRGLVTQSLLQYLRYWIDEYKRQNLVNHLDDAQVGHVRLAAVNRDPYFDAITVRVYADGLDYTTRGQGAIVGGSKDDRRAYTEYWTFIRSAKRRGKPMITPNCPNCGAPLAISDAGACTHCNVQVENGDFDWVLSKIEQDDVYAG